LTPTDAPTPALTPTAAPTPALTPAPTDSPIPALTPEEAAPYLTPTDAPTPALTPTAAPTPALTPAEAAAYSPPPTDEPTDAPTVSPAASAPPLLRRESGLANVAPHTPAGGEPLGAPSASPLPAANATVVWSPADEVAASRQREVAAQAAAEARQAGGSAEPQAEPQVEPKDSSDKALVITLSTIGGVLLLVAGSVGAYYVHARPRAEGPEQREVADAADPDPLLSARGD